MVKTQGVNGSVRLLGALCEGQAPARGSAWGGQRHGQGTAGSRHGSAGMGHPGRGHLLWSPRWLGWAQVAFLSRSLHFMPCSCLL